MTAIRAALSAFRGRLGRIAMYRLLTGLLVGLALIALILSGTGSLTFPIRGLLETAAVLLVVGYATNRLFAAMFKVVPHSESAVITALILFFVLGPSTDPVTLAQVALAALFASASKYLLSVRGRHIFNPAAVGAAWLAVVHLPLALWWVGTPWLLPFVAVAVVLIALRTGKVGLVALFVVLAVAGTAVRTLGDQSAWTAVSFAVTQSPIVFLAGFMLTEPLTLPPRRWQQGVVATIVAALVAFPIQWTDFSVGPETALLVGNLVAFAFGQRRAVEMVLTARSALSGLTSELVFVPRRRVRFAAGQYLELEVPHAHPDRRGSRRMFSIASAPGGADVRLAMRMPDRPSTFKSALHQAPVGTVVRATTVSGDFVLPRKAKAPVLLVAGGIGITPFLSQLQSGRIGDAVVIWAAGADPEQRYLELLKASSARLVVVGGEPGGSRRIDENLLREQVPDIRSRRTYVSGPPTFVTAVAGSARRLRAPRVYTDQFAGY